MARPREYTADKLDKAVERYFRSISREVVKTEMVDTGRIDQYGHAVQEPREILNRLGKPITVVEYVEPPTVAGLCEFLNIDQRTWERYCNEEMHPEFCRTTTRARGRMRAWNERELLVREGNNVKGIIFNLENNYGYREQRSVEVSGSLEQYLQKLSEEGQMQEL